MAIVNKKSVKKEAPKAVKKEVKAKPKTPNLLNVVKKTLGIKKKKKEEKSVAKEYGKVCLYFVIVDFGIGESVINLFRNLGVVATFSHIGEGTANRQVLDVLGIEDNKKDVMYSFVKEESIPDITKELEAFFVANKKNRGIGFSIDLNSMVGVKLYHFLTNTL